MYKKFILLFSFLFLFSCGNSDNQINGEDASVFTGSGFSVKIPESWTSSGSELLPEIANGQVVFSAISNDKKYNFSNNFLIIKEDLSHLGSSVQYSELNNRSTQKKYAEYKAIKSGNFIFSDSDEGKYYAFQARYNANTPKYQFVQSAKMCGTTVFMLHGAVSLDFDSEKIVNIFRTFSCEK